MNKNMTDFGLIGLAVMGQNLALNIADHGFKTSVFNRTFSKTNKFLDKNGYCENLFGFENLQDFVISIQRPRRIVIMVQAGKATDSVIDSLIPLLDEQDIIIDGGNAKWTDTIRREAELRNHKLCFVGSGVSGGEEGARFGPSLMAGGSTYAWEKIKDVWLAISAKVSATSGKPLEGASEGNPITGGVSCAAYIGENGAGHYVKMVHNGIEYGDMQMICEAYHLMTDLLGMTAKEVGDTFSIWNESELDSFLMEISADALQQKDPRTGGYLVDYVLDAAGQKGTGKWTSVNALDMGTPAPTVAEAVFARCMSAIKQERGYASKSLTGPDGQDELQPLDRSSFLEAIRGALYCSKICSYAQGFQLMQAAAKEYDWSLNFGEIAEIWRGGCIIRAAFLQKITEAYQKNSSLANLLLDDYFIDCIKRDQSHWRKVIATGALRGVPTPTFSSALAYYDSYRSARLPQNLLQAQRDYFGAHTYERTDEPRGNFFHMDWLHPERPESKV